MSFLISKQDREFIQQVENCTYPVTDFDHRSHLRLAYVYLTENSVDQAVERVQETLVRLLKFAGIEPTEKYHKTLTQAWLLAVHHFMNKTKTARSADHFIGLNPILLDSSIMLTHYSKGLLFSSEARSLFVEPDLEEIPRYGA